MYLCGGEGGCRTCTCEEDEKEAGVAEGEDRQSQGRECALKKRNSEQRKTRKEQS